ncbi:hypothetical protein DPX16_8381 [Anabarilius grahami]|uniref:Uncharacterized protein n=1 Tax=Anabarilius grahami TaxID=495550 RepID=A0A3N0ZAW4_ANAGA|nr:hypothetical protein DPX16_8381 [Anabarilius grahami]
MGKRKDLSEFDKDQIVMTGKVSEYTRMELHSCRTVRVTMLTPVHRQKSQQWTREHQNWRQYDALGNVLL